MSYPKKVEAALRILETSGLSVGAYAPPLHRFFWKRGFGIPPPHLNGFLFNFLEVGAVFAGITGISKWLASWFRHGTGASLTDLLPTMGFSGLFWGVAVAAYYWDGTQNRNLPRWSSISSEAET